MRVVVFIYILLIVYPVSAQNASVGPLSVPADVVRVYDGDTITVDAHPWPGMTIRTGVRLRGIDTPEIKGKCASEKAAAIVARDRMAVLVGEKVLLENVTPDKYGGRVDATVMTSSGDAGAILISENLARPYAGGKRQGWCD